MNDLAIPIWILAVVSVARLVFAIWQEYSIRKTTEENEKRQDKYDEEYERQQEQHEIQQERSQVLLESLSHKQNEFVDSWRTLVEHQTGKKLADMTDAEIVRLVRHPADNLEEESP